MVLSLAAEGLRFGYPGGPALLDGVSFTMAPGRTLSLLGPNGTGKTTLLRCLLGLEKPLAGQVRVGGRDLAAMSAIETARALAYVPQASDTVFAFDAFDIVMMGRNPHLGFMAGPGAEDRRIAEAAMVRLGIAHLARRGFQQLSGGERQMVLVARALAQGSRVLVLDEPCAGLDIANQMRIIAIVRALSADGYAVLLTTHLPDHAFLLGGEVMLLKQGRLVGPGPPAEVLTAPALAALYGMPIEVIEVAAGPARGQTLCVPIMPPA